MNRVRHVEAWHPSVTWRTDCTVPASSSHCPWMAKLPYINYAHSASTSTWRYTHTYRHVYACMCVFVLMEPCVCVLGRRGCLPVCRWEECECAGVYIFHPQQQQTTYSLCLNTLQTAKETSLDTGNPSVPHKYTSVHYYEAFYYSYNLVKYNSKFFFSPIPSVCQPFDEMGRRIASVMSSTIGLRLFSELDDGTGHTAVELLLDAWLEDGVENSSEVLQVCATCAHTCARTH